MNRKYKTLCRRGLTLLELVVVLGILVILASLVVPNVGGLIFQSRSAGNAALIGDVNRAVNSYVARFAAQPDRWDSLLNTSGTLFNKLHPQLLTSNTALPVLQVTPLDTNQANSLINAGITVLHDADESRTVPPSDNATGDRAIANTANVVTLVKSTVTAPYNSTFLDQAFGLNASKTDKWVNEFVVVGLSSQSAMRGSTMTDIPLVQSATPFNYYARVLCVYMIPPKGGSSFRARYVGCFLPDGTSLPQSMVDYNTAAAMDK